MQYFYYKRLGEKVKTQEFINVIKKIFFKR